MRSLVSELLNERSSVGEQSAGEFANAKGKWSKGAYLKGGRGRVVPCEFPATREGTGANAGDGEHSLHPANVPSNFAGSSSAREGPQQAVSPSSFAGSEIRIAKC